MLRSGCLVGLGIAAYFIFYLFQAIVLVYYMAEHVNGLLGLFIIPYLLSPAYLLFNRCFRTSETRRNAVKRVWFVWFLYIIILIPSVAVIFSSVVNNISTSDKMGPNTLKTVLCITPVLLILLLNTTIPAGNRKFVERLSVIGVLDLFDGIEMLEIILMQEHSFDLPQSLEISIIVFVCVSFLLSPMALYQHKVQPTGEIVTRKKTLLVRTSIQVLFVNMTFLIVRCVVWNNYDYDASIFITKNILSIIISSIEIFAVFDCCKCGNEASETFYV